MDYYSEPPKHFCFEDPGLCWIPPPPQKLMDPMISNNTEKAVYMDLVSLSSRISRGIDGIHGFITMLVAGFHELIALLISGVLSERASGPLKFIQILLTCSENSGRLAG